MEMGWKWNGNGMEMEWKRGEVWPPDGWHHAPECGAGAMHCRVQYAVGQVGLRAKGGVDRPSTTIVVHRE